MTANFRPVELGRLVGSADLGPGDAELLRRYAATRDPEAFAVLVRRHARCVLGACRRVLADPHAAEDAFQATFLQLARKAHTLRTPAALTAWLYRTARRTALRHRRPATQPTPTHRPSPARNPLDVLTARELLATIEDEIDRLPESYRLPVVLCYIDGLSKGAAAERLGLPADVVHGRLDRGREKLRAALARRGLAPVVVLGLLIPATAPASAELLERTVGICVGGQSVPVTIAALAAGRSVAVSPNGRMIARETCDLAADGGDGVELSEILGRQSVVIEDVVTGRSLIQIRQPDYLQRRSNLFTPDGQVLVTWTSTYPAGGARGRPPEMTTVRLWELRTGKERLAFNLPVIGEWWEFEPWGVTLSADGRLLASARPDKTISVRDLATGAEVAKRSGYRTIIDCLAFRPDGKAPASGHADGTALIWDLSGVAAATPAAMDREAAWKEPASDDAGKAYRAILALAVDPGFVAMLRERLKPVVTPPADQIRKLIADLDNATFATRQRATAELTKLGDAADDQLRAALKGDLTAEQRGRVEGILGKRGLTESDPDQLRPLRCVEVLEKSGSAEAQAVLAELAKGAAGARLTRESNDAVRRMLAGPRRQD